MPFSLAGFIRMLRDNHHTDRCGEIRNRRKNCNRRIAQLGKTFDNLRQPKRDPIKTNDDCKIEHAKLPNSPMLQRLPQRETVNMLLFLLFLSQGLVKPILLGSRQPLRMFWLVDQVKKRNKS